MFNSGDFIYRIEGELFHAVQILEITSTDFLIKDFWETHSLTDLAIRSWVKRVPIPELSTYIFDHNEIVTPTDLLEMEKFLEIERGLQIRKNRTASMEALVDESMQSENYLEALELLTEWAMLDKYRPEIYLKREECLRKLGRNTEADYELHVYNTITGK